MRRHFISTTLIIALIFTVHICSAAGKVNSTPASVVQAIFNAAKTGNYTALQSLCAPSQKGDGDTKMICSMSDQSSEVKREFREQFRTGRIIGKAVIKGDEASVKIKFGADGKSDEEFHLVRMDEKWYLISY